MVRNFGEDPNLWPGESTVIAILDLATGEVVELDSTVARNPDVGPPCHLGCGEGSNDAPSWSADGSRLLFARSGIGTPNEPRTIHDTVLFVVDADGANLRQLVPTELFARDAQWSPDGSLIAFTSGIEVLSLDDFGLLENWHQLNDIYTVRPDGTNIRRLTRFTAGPVPEAPGDLGPSGPMWTRDGRIVFQRRVGDPADPGSSASDWELWVMDSDGGNATRLDGEATTMTAAGCVICAYPFPDSGDYPRFAFWRALP
jgi:dipeptidyl aminopeptidase/acylaminoacyl peptidase